MNVLDFTPYDRVFCYGDIHGEFDKFSRELSRRLTTKGQEKKEKDGLYKLTKRASRSNENLDNSIVIVVGDIGVGFDNMKKHIEVLNEINNNAKMNKTHILFMRGNHDDPSYFTTDKYGLSNVHFIQDYTVVITKNYKTLCVGGAISCDRSWRVSQEKLINDCLQEDAEPIRLYWKDEAVVLDNDKIEEIKNSNIEIDSLMTHTHLRIEQLVSHDEKHESWLDIDSSLKGDLENESKAMSTLYETFKNNLKFWCSGHVHLNNTVMVDNTVFIQAANDYSPKNIAMLIDIKKNGNSPTAEVFKETLKATYASSSPWQNLEYVSVTDRVQEAARMEPAYIGETRVNLPLEEPARRVTLDERVGGVYAHAPHPVPDFGEDTFEFLRNETGLRF